MLILDKCTLIETYVADTVSTVGMIEEGSAMVEVLEGGLAKVQPSTGAANEIFVGVSISRPTLATIVTNVETITVPSSGPYTVTLGKPISSSGLRATQVVGNARTPITAGNPGTTAAQYSIAGNVITFNSAQANKTIELAYQTAISYQEAVYRYAFDVHEAAARTNIGTMGICSVGIMYTSKFDVAADFASFALDNPIKLAANGNFTIGGSGTATDAKVREVPTGGNGGVLGISLGLKHS